jgi:hypothetical protein
MATVSKVLKTETELTNEQAALPADSEERNATKATRLAKLVQTYRSSANTNGQCGGAVQIKGGCKKSASRISLRKLNHLRGVPQTQVCQAA